MEINNIKKNNLHTKVRINVQILIVGSKYNEFQHYNRGIQPHRIFIQYLTFSCALLSNDFHPLGIFLSICFEICCLLL